MKIIYSMFISILLAVLIFPITALAMEPNQMPQMMGNPNMDPQMMRMQQQNMQRQQMMQMRQQNMPMYGPAGMHTNHSMCNHSAKQKNKQSKKMIKQNIKVAHMKNMEKRLANIEALLKELVELQKNK